MTFVFVAAGYVLLAALFYLPYWLKYKRRPKPGKLANLIAADGAAATEELRKIGEVARG